MTKKDYVLIAAIIRNLEFPGAKSESKRTELRRTVAFEFMINLVGTKPLFDKEKFFQACLLRPTK